MITSSPFFLTNASGEERISLTFGFHRRASVLGARAALSMKGGGVYDEQRIFDRSAVIAVAIDARRQHFPDEQPYRYEPFSGLDPVGRKDIRDILLEQRKRGMTLLLTSHVLSDVEMLCNRVGIIQRGRMTAQGTLDELLRPEVRRARFLH